MTVASAPASSYTASVNFDSPSKHLRSCRSHADLLRIAKVRLNCYNFSYGHTIKISLPVSVTYVTVPKNKKKDRCFSSNLPSRPFRTGFYMSHTHHGATLLKSHRCTTTGRYFKNRYPVCRHILKVLPTRPIYTLPVFPGQALLTGFHQQL